jgi:hypothetical protein
VTYIQAGEILSAVRRPPMDTRPDAEKCTRQKHEQQTAQDMENEQARELNLADLGALEDLLSGFGDFYQVSLAF